MNEMTVTSINERAAEEYYRRGLEAEQQGNPEKAVEFYERALNENPDHESACFNLAVLYDRRAEDAKAIELYERICTSEPVHVNALLNLAILYEDNNHYEEAHRCLDAVLRSDPNHQRARLYMKDVESARSMYYDEDGDRRGDRKNAVLDIPLSDFELSVRSRNCLKKMNLRSLGDLLKTTEQELLSYKNFGETSLNEIKALLSQKGLRLGQAQEDKGGVRRPLGLGGTASPAAAAASNVSPEIYGKSVADLELSVRSRNCLKKMNLRSLGDLLKTTEQELLSYKNFGETSLNEIKALLTQKGLRLGQAQEDKGGVRRPLGLGGTASPAAAAASNVSPELFSKSVADLELSVRSRKALQRLNINSLGELASRTEDELLGCKNFGQTSLTEIKQQLATFGMNLRKLED